MNFLKNRRFLMVAGAIVFIAALLWFKTRPATKINSEDIAYNATGEEVVQDLVNKDSDNDGVMDWEEGLWGTDPNNKETTPGIADSEAIKKIKADQITSGNLNIDLTGVNKGAPNETDKFSQELFSTVGALSQNGTIDQATIDKISASLQDRIENNPPRKVFTSSDIKITTDNSAKSIKAYSESLNQTVKKYPVTGDVIAILSEFAPDANNVNVEALTKLDPITNQLKARLDAALTITVPQSFVSLHLNLLNAAERLIENFTDLKMYDKDVIVALSAMTQYDKNNTDLGDAVKNLAIAVQAKLKN